MSRFWLSAAVVVSIGTMLMAQPPSKTRRLFVSVVDGSNAPVQNLTTADFQVKENGVERTVVRAVLHQPLRLALMVDNSDGAAQAIAPLRTGVHAFLDAIPPEVEVILLTTGRQLRIRVPATTD